MVYSLAIVYTRDIMGGAHPGLMHHHTGVDLKMSEYSMGSGVVRPAMALRILAGL